MIFEKEKYYGYIKTLENITIITYICIIIITAIIGLSISKNLIGLIIGIGIGFLIGNIYTIKTKIKIQEMKWKLDIYNKIKLQN